MLLKLVPLLLSAIPFTNLTHCRYDKSKFIKFRKIKNLNCVYPGLAYIKKHEVLNHLKSRVTK